jgi:hypothetical protein
MTPQGEKPMTPTTHKKTTMAKREPVILAFILAAVPVIAAFALQVLDTTDVLDNAEWLRVLLTGLGPLIGSMTALWARGQVDSPVTVARKAHLPKTHKSSNMAKLDDPPQN